MLGKARTHWRVTLLVLLLAVSAAVLFLPQFAPTEAGDDETTIDRGFTNLQFGLELSGGTRIRAPLAGLTAEDLEFDPEDTTEIESTVAEELDLSTRDVNAYPGPEGEARVEVTTDGVSESDFVAALGTAGLDATEDDVRRGVTEETVNEAVEVLEDKLRESPFARGTVSKATSPTGEQFVVIEVPGGDRSAVLDLVEDRGVVEVVATYPAEDGQANETVLERDDFQTIGTASDDAPHGPHVPVVLTEEGAQQFTDAMRQNGFTDEGVGQCRYEQNPDDPGYCLLTVVDGEVVDAHSMGPSLAESIESGEFLDSRNFVMEAPSMDDARSLQVNLRAGALPAPLNLDGGTQYFLEPSLAQEFKLLSLFTGLVAVFAVAGVVAARYRNPRVGVPMVLTASGEVFLLLGFAAGIGYPLDLAAIAGFIAVVGTGVDDLIIIADEILQEGDVSTGRVFESRFRKAFWVIGAAAATTIVAMLPLAFLSLGDLRGFALFTIVGVLIGVLITRPAYGDILRIVLTEEHTRRES